MAPQKVLEVSTATEHLGSSGCGPSEISPMVGDSSKSPSGLSFTPKGTQPFNLYRCLNERLGRSLRRRQAKWPLVSSRYCLAHQSVRAKGCFSRSKRILSQTDRKGGASLLRQFHSGQLPKQGRGHKVLPNGRFSVENSGLGKCQGNSAKSKAFARLSKCDSGWPVQKRQNSAFRVVSTSAGVSKDLPGMAYTRHRHVCHSPKQKVGKVCVSNSGSRSLGSGLLKSPMAGSERICFLPNDNSGTGGAKNDHLPLPDDCDSSGVAGDALVLGSPGSFLKPPCEVTSVAQSFETATQSVPSQKPGVSQSPCLASRLKAGQPRRFTPSVEARIKAPQRHSSRRVYSSRWSIYRHWCLKGKMDVTEVSIPQVADFLLYLFESKKLKPATIAGYRTAIADGLGSSGDLISTSRDLNRLISSFYRDQPRINRSIPSWDLSLVLRALTKAPFEPLEKASLKDLTLKTVFLLALASGKRRGEIHAWTFSSVLFKGDKSQVTVAPSPPFLAKNQLASEGPASIKTVVIPALTNILGSGMTEDVALCPVRALRVYLRRTKQLRSGKSLLFVSYLPNFSRDIARATISQWIKRLIQYCYNGADNENLKLAGAKAHDVRALAASLAFKGGVSLSEILESCFWKSHSTFTNFYLKDVCWDNNDIFKLGPLVAAQHIISSMSS